MYMFARPQPFGLVLLAISLGWRTLLDTQTEKMSSYEQVEDLTDDEQALYNHQRRSQRITPTIASPLTEASLQPNMTNLSRISGTNSSNDTRLPTRMTNSTPLQTFTLDNTLSHEPNSPTFTPIYDWMTLVEFILAIYSVYSTTVWLLTVRPRRRLELRLAQQELYISELEVTLENREHIATQLKHELRHQKEKIDFLVKGYDELKVAREESVYASKCLRDQNEHMRKEIIANTERYKRVIQDLPLLLLPPEIGLMPANERFSELTTD